MLVQQVVFVVPTWPPVKHLTDQPLPSQSFQSGSTKVVKLAKFRDSEGHCEWGRYSHPGWKLHLLKRCDGGSWILQDWKDYGSLKRMQGGAGWACLMYPLSPNGRQRPKGQATPGEE